MRPIAAFTLIELMIVIAIIAIIAAIAIPNLLESRISAAESSAAAGLRSGLFSGQEVFRASGHNDLDGDNQGEFGHIGHLSGSRETWGTPNRGFTGTAVDSLELMGAEYAAIDPLRLEAGSTLNSVNGYFYATFLDVDSSIDPTLDPLSQQQVNNAEIYFAAVAVPQVYNDTGRRAFVITNSGVVLTSVGTDLFESDAAAVLDSATNEVGCYDTISDAVTRDNRRPFWKKY